MAKLQPVRGTRDIYGEESVKFRQVVRTAESVAGRFGFSQVQTPIFESTEVFSRPLGDTSDIVTKEMYTFEDRGGDSVTLRPEGTAPLVRAFISNGLTNDLPAKYFYHGPFFRYERPQKGRYRQLHQVGFELLGANSPAADTEVIAAAYLLLEELGIADKVMLNLNSLGDLESRQTYRDQLVAYFSKYKNDLSADSQVRLEKNPMRILDSKADEDQEIVAGAPTIAEAFNDVSRTFFDTVLNQLSDLGIPHTVNPKIVRGLDYYTHTTFEFITTELGSQGTVLAGGRYDGLVKQMGGPDLPGVGWGAGIDRLSMLTTASTDKTKTVSIVPMDDAALKVALQIAGDLRKNGICVDNTYSGNMKKRMQYANKIQADWAVIIGEDELANQQATLRNLESGEQQAIAFDKIADYLTGADS